MTSSSEAKPRFDDPVAGDDAGQAGLAPDTRIINMRPGAHSAEEEYIAREEADRQRERVLDRRAETDRLAVQERERLKAAYFMRCPQCGGELQVATLQGIDAAQCVECSGVWLDSAEFEQLAGKRTGLLKQLISVFGGTRRSA